jgi:uncharacterized Zn finger protein
MDRERRDRPDRPDHPHRPGRPRRRRPRGRRPRRPAPALPPPEHGIRVQQIGGTWWGERWVTALMRFGSQYVARLARGTTYAQQGRVHDLRVSKNVVTAHVTGSRPEPYRVTLALKPLRAATWAQAIEAMAGKARFAAELLAGQMPREIDEAFAGARASLFPLRRQDLKTRCSCPDAANPCKHIAALHLVLAEAFDRDPFLLFELRGRSKGAVLEALRELRSGGARAGEPGGLAPAGAAAAPGAAASPRGPRQAAAAPLAPAEGIEAADASVPWHEFRQPIDDLRFAIGAPATHGAVLRQLGPPPAWSLDKALAELLQPALARASRLAQQIALDAQPDTRARKTAPPRPAAGKQAPAGDSA